MTGEAMAIPAPPPFAGDATSDAILARLLSLHPKMIDLTLDRVLGVCSTRSAIPSAPCRR
jgi:hypothetical protein